MKNGLAVVGCGDWGKNLVRNFHELRVLTHVCDSDISRLADVQASYSNLVAAPAFETLLSNEAIKSFVIATPAEHHWWMAKAALEAGKDVFVEKPLALQYRDGEELVRLAEGSNRI